MTRRSSIFTFSLLVALTGLLPGPAAAADTAPWPASMAAVGDSISQAASTGGVLGADYPQNSWSTGTSSAVNSHYLRLLAAGAPIGGRNHNLSVSGAKVADLDGQMRNAVALQPDYVTVLIGGNDLCTDTVAQMTSVADFETRFRTAMTTVTQGSPETYVYVVSIPDVYQLWNLFRNDWWARFIWSTAGICQSLLANPTSTQQADVDRRAAVRQRNLDFNATLAAVCGQFDRCHWDGGAVFGTTFTTSDVSGDYFHPSLSGQAKLAAVTWNAGYAWTTAPPPPNAAPVADFGVSCLDLACTFTDTSTDDGAIVAWSWSFGDGATSTQPSPSHTFGAADTYSVSLTVADDDGATDTITKAITVSTAPAEVMIVEDLAATSARVNKNAWNATVVVHVTGPDGRGVAGASVSASWTVGAPDGCTTASDGRCAMTSDNLNARKVASVGFTVTGVSHATLAWDDTQGQITTTVARPA